MASNDDCTNCKNRNSCTALCEDMEKILTADIPKKTPQIQILGGYEVEYKDYEEQERDLDSLRKLDSAAVGFRSTTDSDLDRNFDRGPIFEPTGLILDDKTRNFISEYTRRCHHKEKKFKKHLFNAFLRCNTEKKIALKAGKHKNVIQKYLARICNCIVDWLAKQGDEDLKNEMDLTNFYLTPLKFKNKFIIPSGFPQK